MYHMALRCLTIFFATTVYSILRSILQYTVHQFISSAREDTCTYIRMYHMALRCPPDAFSKEYIDVAMYSRNS
jgi:hypothetical protein